MKQQLNKLFKSLIPAKNFVVITVRLDTEVRYSLQFINEKSSSLSLESFYNDVEEEQLIKLLKPEIPVILSFQGDKVLSKDIELSMEVGSVLFNEDKEDFFISQFHDVHTNFVSIVRREEVLKVLSLFKDISVTVLDFSVGPFVGLLLKDFVKESVLYSDTFKLDFSNNEGTITYKKVNEVQTQVYVGKDALNQFQVPLIGTYFNYKSQQLFIDGKTAILKDEINEFKKHQLFIKALMVTVFTVLLTLIISTILRDHYQTKYVESEAQLFYLEKSYNEIVSLKQEKQQLESLVSNLSGFPEEYYTHYVYYLIKTLPEGVRLDNVRVNPIVGKLSKGKDIKFSLNQIIFKGTINDSKNLSKWTEITKKQNWVKSIEIIELYQDRNDRLLFTLQVDF